MPATPDAGERADSVIVTDLEGIITYWNEGATRLFGWRAEEMLGRHYSARFPEAARSGIVEEIRSRADGEDWSGEYEDYRKDGSRVWIEARVNRFTDADGKPIGLIGLAYDITDRIRAEQRLARARNASDSSPNRSRTWSGRPGRMACPSISMLDCSTTSASLPGRSGPGTGSRRSTPTIVRCPRRLGAALRDGAEYRIEYRLRNGKTGEYRWFIGHALPQREAGGRIVRWFGTCTDIDHRKRAEQEFRYLLEKLPAAAYMCDPDGLITYFNPHAIDLWGMCAKTE